MEIKAPDAQLYFYPDFIESSIRQVLFDQLFASLVWQQDNIVVYGKEHKIPRLQAWYGDNDINYQYSGLALQTRPWTSTLLSLKQQIEQQCDYAFNSVLANLYRDGQDTVGWHSDDEAELGKQPVIASLSVGATRKFALKHKVSGEKLNLALTSGSLLVMAGDTQHYWQHCLPRTKKVEQARINLTFRKVFNSY